MSTTPRSGSWREADCCGEGRVLAVTTLTPVIRRTPTYNGPQRTAGQSPGRSALTRTSRCTAAANSAMPFTGMSQSNEPQRRLSRQLRQAALAADPDQAVRLDEIAHRHLNGAADMEETSAQVADVLQEQNSRARAFSRDKRLIELGYPSYKHYLNSQHWRTVRDRYWNDPNTPKECLCGETERLQLHHKTYMNVGAELLADLRLLCPQCHTDVHVLAKRGEMDLGLKNYADPRRAQRYASDPVGKQIRERRDTELSADHLGRRRKYLITQLRGLPRRVERVERGDEELDRLMRALRVEGRHAILGGDDNELTICEALLIGMQAEPTRSNVGHALTVIKRINSAQQERRTAEAAAGRRAEAA